MLVLRVMFPYKLFQTRSVLLLLHVALGHGFCVWTPQVHAEVRSIGSASPSLQGYAARYAVTKLLWVGSALRMWELFRDLLAVIVAGTVVLTICGRHQAVGGA